MNNPDQPTNDTSPDLRQAQRRPPSSARPATVRNAFWMWLVAIASTLASVVIAEVFFNQLQMYQMSGIRGTPLATSPFTHQAMEVSRIVVGVLWAVLLAVWLLFAVKMRAGRHWARSILLKATCVWCAGGVFVGGAAATGLIPFPAPAWYWALTTLTTVASLAAVVLGYRPSARPYFGVPQPPAPHQP